MSDLSDITGIAKIVNSEVANKLYDDAMAEPARVIGGIAADVLKGVRCFTRLFRLAGNAMDRLCADLETCRQRVPEDRQVESPPEIAGPALERLRFLEDTNPLRQMYLNLLTTSIDRERQSQAHPAFVTILSQMSRDEAILIDALRQPATVCVGGQRRVLRHDLIVQISTLAFPDRLLDALEHLEALGLVAIDIPMRIPITVSDERAQERIVGVTGFGVTFLDACMT